MKKVMGSALTFLLCAGSFANATFEKANELLVQQQYLAEGPLDPKGPITVEYKGLDASKSYPTGKIYYNDVSFCGYGKQYRYMPTLIYGVKENSYSLLKNTADDSYHFGYTYNGNALTFSSNIDEPENWFFYSDCGKHEVEMSIEEILKKAYQNENFYQKVRLTIDRLRYSTSYQENIDNNNSTELWWLSGKTKDWADDRRLARAIYYVYLSRPASVFQLMADEHGEIRGFGSNFPSDFTLNYDDENGVQTVYEIFAPDIPNDVSITRQARRYTYSAATLKYVAGEWQNISSVSTRNEKNYKKYNDTVLVKKNLGYFEKGDSLVEIRDRVIYKVAETYGQTVVDSVFSGLMRVMPKYNVQASKGNSGGTVEIINGYYKAGELVSLKATPDAGYEFVCWKSGNECVSEAAKFDLKVRGDTIVKGFFKVRKLEVSLVNLSETTKKSFNHIWGQSTLTLSGALEGTDKKVKFNLYYMHDDMDKKTKVDLFMPVLQANSGFTSASKTITIDISNIGHATFKAYSKSTVLPIGNKKRTVFYFEAINNENENERSIVSFTVEWKHPVVLESVSGKEIYNQLRYYGDEIPLKIQTSEERKKYEIPDDGNGFYYDYEWICKDGSGNEKIYGSDVESVKTVNSLSCRVAAIKKNIVVFSDYDGTVLKQDSVVEGTAASAPEISHKGLTFKGWDDSELDNVTNPKNVTATYEVKTEPEYNITVTDYKTAVKASDVKVLTPNKCFIVTNQNFKEIHKGFDYVEGRADADRYVLDVSVDVVDTGSCADDSLVNIWKFYRETNITPAVKVNGMTNKDMHIEVLVKENPSIQFQFLWHPVWFVDYDGKVLKKDMIADKLAAEPPKDPVHKGLTFKGWNEKLDSITTSIIVKATYEAKTVPEYNFTVTDYKTAVKASDVKVLTPGKCFTVTKQGFNAVYPNDYVEGRADADRYVLDVSMDVADTGACADDSLVNIWKFLYLTGKFIDPKINGLSTGFFYEISDVIHMQFLYYWFPVWFVDYDGKVLKTDKVGINQAAEPPKDPVHKGLTFKGWDDSELDNIGISKTVKATYEVKTVPEYNFTVTDYKTAVKASDVKVLTPSKCFIVTKQEFKEINSDDYVEGRKDAWRYVFDVNVDLLDTGACADDSLVNIWKFLDLKGISVETKVNDIIKIFSYETSDVVRMRFLYYWYTVQFVDYDGKVLKTDKIGENQAAVPPEDPVRSGYIFKGWDQNFDSVNTGTSVQATYERLPTVVVSFLDFNGLYIDSEEIVKGDSVTSVKPPVHAGLTFVGWSKDLKLIAQDDSVYAVYKVAASPDYIYTISGLEVGKPSQDIKIQTPNSCFMASFKELYLNNKIYEGTLQGGKYVMYMHLSVSDDNACAKDSLVNIWMVLAQRNINDLLVINGEPAYFSGDKRDGEIVYSFELKAPSSSSTAKPSSSAAKSSSSVAKSSSSAAKSSSSVAKSSGSVAKSSSSVAKSSSSKGKNAVASAKLVPQFRLVTVGRNIQIAGARKGSAYAVFDMQGLVVKSGIVDDTEFNVSMNRAGAYLVRIGNEVQQVNVR